MLSVRDLDLFLALAQETCVERRWLVSGKTGIDRPVFFLLEGLDFSLAINNQTERDGLYTSGREPAPDLIP